MCNPLAFISKSATRLQRDHLQWYTNSRQSGAFDGDTADKNGTNLAHAMCQILHMNAKHRPSLQRLGRCFYFGIWCRRDESNTRPSHYEMVQINQGKGKSATNVVDKGLLLRTKALALLQEAQAVDGLKPFTITHTHSFGESTYVLWAAKTPTREEAEVVLDSEFEPDREETLVVADCFTLEEMSGVAITARLPDILESLHSPGQDDNPSPCIQ